MNRQNPGYIPVFTAQSSFGEGRYLEIWAEQTVNYREISGEINDVKNYPNYLATQDQLMFNKYNTGARVSRASSWGET